MTNTPKPEALASLVERLRKLEAKSTPAPWEVDSEYDHDAHYSGGGGCGCGFKNFFVGAEVNGQWKTLFDTVNSDLKLIEEDYDEDGSNAWDSIGLANAELVAALRNALPEIATSITTLVAERDALRHILETITAMQALRYGDATRTHMALIGLCVTARATLERTAQP